MAAAIVPIQKGRHWATEGLNFLSVFLVSAVGFQSLFLYCSVAKHSPVTRSSSVETFSRGTACLCEVMTSTNKSLLATEMEEENDETMFKQILLKATQEMQSRMPITQDSKPIQPQPGFCIKTRSSQNDKIFVNICKSEHIPAPPDFNEQELVSILESDDPSGFRVPMSLGEAHTEMDNSGNACSVYDVAINSTFFQKIQGNELFMEFFITVTLEGLENKYQLELSREWRMLKNRKFMGSVSEQNIRTKSKPIIQEMETSNEHESRSKPLVTELDSSPAVPEFTITAEPAEGQPSYLVAEISLPKTPSVRSLVLDLGEDRILLWGHPDLYHLEVFIPYNIIQEDSGAQFNKSTKVLTITMPVQPA
ncbi:PIH1 domain-containing protein 1 [Ambystoma mexicanum]|uniref:PIH1 domain-containing protein 1 n=1 Tax=Ambystoma mexicanum TaxID=8296 RepID=UPI0037E88686